MFQWIKNLFTPRPSEYRQWKATQQRFSDLVRRMSFKDRCRLYTMKPGDRITIFIDGEPHTFSAGDSVRLK